MKAKLTVAVMLITFKAFALSPEPPASYPKPPASATMRHILEAHELRVCTPGDYKPFSLLKAPDAFEGLDVDLMTSLAQSLGVELKIIKTTWATLMADFGAGKCDIAAGGISVTLGRQMLAYFSAPYMVNGKTPITRCENVNRFQTVEAIDQPGVRVIVNPGGSNEKFAEARLPHARLIIHKDNLGIFDELIAGRADVFVTEAAEAIVQSKAHPELCAVNPDKPLQYAEMAYLLPSGDEVFKRYVDQWLHLAQASGELAAIRERWLAK